MPRYIALLRGVNVGGNSMVRMSELKECFEAQGFENVATYINSGNIAFDARSASETAVEKAIEKHFSRHIDVMLRKQSEITQILNANPLAGAYENPKQMHVLFLKGELPLEKQFQLSETDFGDEVVICMDRQIYVLMPAGVTESVFSKKAILDKKPRVLYTGRNIRTVEKLAGL
jgi:uncharacterized protein (DUF1697 family)